MTVMIAVGSHKQGITSVPSVFFVGIDIENTFEPVDKLHALPIAIVNSTTKP